jgi:superfamily I DNA/RNA helicase
VPFRAADLRLPIESPVVDRALEQARAIAMNDGLLRTIGRLREARLRAAPTVAPGGDEPAADDPAAEEREVLTAMLGWAAGSRDLGGLAARIGETRALLDELRADDARLTLATAHGTKGLEFDHVAVIGLDDGRFPNARSVAEALEPERALEEERRLAYVAWTRACRSLTLVYDPGAPSQFLLEAFDAVELGLPGR